MNAPTNAAAKHKPPIGIQTFRLIREEGHYHVDKIALIQRLVEEGGHRLLSLPQRFGKSLLLILLPDPSRRLAQNASVSKLLAANDFEGLETLLRTIFASIPRQWHLRNEIQAYEGYCVSMVYPCFAIQGLDSGRRGQFQRRPHGQGGPLQRRRLHFRVQDRRSGARGEGTGANQEKRPCGQISALGPVGPPDWGRIQPGRPQHRRFRGGACSGRKAGIVMATATDGGILSFTSAIIDRYSQGAWPHIVLALMKRA